MPRKAKGPTYLKKQAASGKLFARTFLFGHEVGLGDYGSPESYQRFARVQAEYAAATANGGASPLPPGGLTVNALCARYLEHSESYYRDADGPTGEVREVALALRPLRRLYGDTPAEEFGPLRLKAVRQSMVDGSWLTMEEKAGRKAAGHKATCCRRTTNQRVSKICRAFRWAVGEELLPPSVYQALRSVPGLRVGRSEAAERPDVPPVPDSVVDATLPFLGAVVRAMVELQRLTGMRPGEVCKLCPGMVDRDGLKVDGTEVWVIRFGRKHKTGWQGHLKAVPLGPRAQAVLLPFLDRPPDAPCFSPAESVEQFRAAKRAARQTPVQPSQRYRRRERPKKSPGGRWTVGAYGKAVAAACRRAGVEPWAANRLRHSVGTMVQREYGLDAARAVLGHSDPKTTLIYAARDMQTAAEVAARLG